jgi:serine/threonine-protein kinase
VRREGQTRVRGDNTKPTTELERRKVTVRWMVLNFGRRNSRFNLCTHLSHGTLLIPRTAMSHATTNSKSSCSTTLPIAGASFAPFELAGWQMVEPIAIRLDTAIYAARPIGDDGDCQYCVKMVRNDVVSADLAVALLRREAFVGRKVFHPHLISVLESHLDDSPYFLVMPLLEGQSVRKRIDRLQTLSISSALWIARQAAEALAELHQHGWLHSDVKPSNIFVAADGHVTLLDLGFVRKLDESGSVVDRQIAGTFNYIAPEMITSTIAADQRSDIYSLGATFYEMLSGHPPLEARTLDELASQHRQRQPNCIRTLRQAVPKKVASLVHRMLAKEPLRRPQSADEVVRELVSLEIDSFALQVAAR